MEGQRLQEGGYVALSRARQQTRLYVTGVPRERESHFHDLDDRDPLTRLGQALEESAIERLALDQQPLPSGPLHDTRAEIEQFKPTPELRARLRLLEQQRLATTKARQQAERTLHDAERNLERLGPLRRGQTRQELLGDIARCRAAIRTADDGLTKLAQEERDLRRPPLGPQPPSRPAADLTSAPTHLVHELDDAAIEL